MAFLKTQSPALFLLPIGQKRVKSELTSKYILQLPRRHFHHSTSVTPSAKKIQNKLLFIPISLVPSPNLITSQKWLPNPGEFWPCALLTISAITFLKTLWYQIFTLCLSSFHMLEASTKFPLLHIWTGDDVVSTEVLLYQKYFIKKTGFSAHYPHFWCSYYPRVSLS